MSNFANPENDSYALRIILASGTSALPSVVFANDLTHGLFWDVDGLHLTGLSATPSDATEATSKAYVDAQISGSSGANINLSNLDSTAVNASIIASDDGTVSLGDMDLSWLAAWVYKVAFANDINNFIGQASTDDFRFEAFSGACGIRLQPTVVSLTADNVVGIQLDGTATAGDTAMLLWDVDSGSLQRVTVGAADSGGTGFKLLRIPN